MSNILISLSHCPWLVAITLMLSSAHLVLISDLNLIILTIVEPYEILIPHELIISDVNCISYGSDWISTGINRCVQLDDSNHNIYLTLGTHLLSNTNIPNPINNIINTTGNEILGNRNLNTIDVNDVINRSYSIIPSLIFIDLLQIIRLDLVLTILILCVRDSIREYTSSYTMISISNPVLCVIFISSEILFFLTFFWSSYH